MSDNQFGPGMHRAPLGAFTFENGRTISELVMSYAVHGTPAPARDNVVLLLHGLVADHTQLAGWVGSGPGHAIDTDRFCVIAPDTLAAVTDDPRLTTSPTRSGQGMAFPRFTIRDMVAAEQRLMAGLGITRMTAVVGVSLGGIETLQWALSFPDAMAAVVPVTPAARTAHQTTLLLEAARQVIALDPAWRDGHYPADAPPRAGTTAALLVQSLFGSSAAGFQDRFDTAPEASRFYLDQSTGLATHADARDWIYRTWAADTHDITADPRFDGDLAAAGQAIRARTLIPLNLCDQLLPPRESDVLTLARAVPDVKVVDFDDPEGHYAHRTLRGMALLTDEISDLLTRVTEGRPGFRGPRYPRSWTDPSLAS